MSTRIEDVVKTYGITEDNSAVHDVVLSVSSESVCRSVPRALRQGGFGCRRVSRAAPRPTHA